MAERCTVEGAVQSLIFQNEDNGYTVLSLLTEDGELVTVVGCIPCAAPVAARNANTPSCSTSIHSPRYQCMRRRGRGCRRQKRAAFRRAI